MSHIFRKNSSITLPIQFSVLGIGVLTGATTRSAPDSSADPDFVLQWGLLNSGQTIGGQPGFSGADIGIAGAWSVHDGNPSVVVAVVGPGVDAHPEFADRLLTGRAFIGDPFDTTDTRGNGTHVAGIIAASRDNGVGISGINPHALILPVRVTDGSLSNEAVAAAGIIWAVDQGAEVIVVTRTYHLGTPTLADAIAYAVDHDVLIVAPVGDEENPEILFPATFDGCLAVSATTNQDFFAPISNWHAGVEISAPGQDIWSTSRVADGFEYRSGSTMAAGFVAGVASLIRSYAPHQSAVEVRQILVDTGFDLGDPGPDERFGAGRLDAAAALNATPAPALRFEPIDAVPSIISPNDGARFQIQIASVVEQVVPNSTLLRFRANGDAFAQASLTPQGGGVYEVDIPAPSCGSLIEFYFQAHGHLGTTVNFPPGAPQALFSAEAIVRQTVFFDDFEQNRGWVIETDGSSPVSGEWVRDVPVGTSVQPAFDASPGVDGACFLTGQYYGGAEYLTDLDGGPVLLTSPPITLSEGDYDISYSVWLRSENGESDSLTVEASTDGGASWSTVEIIEAGVTWESHGFRLSNFPALNGDSLRVRFSIADEPNDSLTEAAVDEFRVTALQCDVLQGDGNGDGVVDFLDLIGVTACLTGPGPIAPAEPCLGSDLNRDTRVDLRDFGVLQRWFGAR